MERLNDKRKADERDSTITSDNDSASETSRIKNPTKRPRVDALSPSKEKVSSEPTGNGKADHPIGENGDLPTGADGEEEVITKNKFDLPTPYTTQEIAQKIGSNNCENGDNEGDESTQFLISIIQQSQQQKKLNRSPISKPKRNGNAKSVTDGNESSSVPIMTSSPSETLPLQNHQTLDVSIKVSDSRTGSVILEETVLKSDYQKVEAFLRMHSYKINVSSQNSGYLADNSSISDNSSSKSRMSRWTISSLGSTIPRESMVSIATDMSESPESMKKQGKLTPSRARKRNEGPIMSSTKIVDEDEEDLNSNSNKVKVIKGLSNGSSDLGSFSLDDSSTKSNVKKGRVTQKDEGIGSMTGTPSQTATPTSARAKSALKSANSTPASAAVTNSGGAKSGGRKRRLASANNFPITNPETPPAIQSVLQQPPPARSVAKIEGTAAKPLTKFETEMNNEPVVESILAKSETLYTTILPDEPVFARWRDKNYYSGIVKSKGLNDTWVIDFDDGMEDVASETHIIPLRILGVGVQGIYSPDEQFKPRLAEIIGHKFVNDGEVKHVKYAIKFEEDGEMKLMWCSRRQLSIKEGDAKKLRPGLVSASGVRPGDVSLDNIVSGPRRRTRGGESEDPNISKNLSSDIAKTPDNRSNSDGSNSARKSRGKKTPATEGKRKKLAVSPSSSSSSKETSKQPSPSKEVVEKEPISACYKMRVTIEIGKKRPKKSLFQNMQFFLTAAGGGDPGISGPQTELTPYDKDDLREQIESCGGEVLDTVGDERKENVFLISDGYARTVKYIYSLASGIPCVCHTWLKQCLENNEIVDWSIFLLPAGWSLEHQDLITNHCRKPLKSFKIFVTSESDQLYNYWRPVLTAAEAVLVKPPRKKGQLIPNGTEVVVTDNHSEATRNLLEEAEAMKVPVVKPEWLVQTIITGEMAHMYGHEKYKVVLDELEESEEISENLETDETSGNHSNAILEQMESPD